MTALKRAAVRAIFSVSWIVRDNVRAIFSGSWIVRGSVRAIFSVSWIVRGNVRVHKPQLLKWDTRAEAQSEPKSFSAYQPNTPYFSATKRLTFTARDELVNLDPSCWCLARCSEVCVRTVDPHNGRDGPCALLGAVWCRVACPQDSGQRDEPWLPSAAWSVDFGTSNK